MWLHPYGIVGWRELQWSMSWLDQAVSLILIIILEHLSQNHHANFWDFKMGVYKTPGSVVTCQRVILKYFKQIY